MTMRWLTITLLAVALALGVSARARAANTGEVELTREGKVSIQLSQQWLASQQRADGSFSQGRGQGAGIVASGVLAWMVNGNLPGEGPFGKQVAKGIDYILSCAQPSGLLFKGQDGQVMYQHGLATLCLAEVWGQTQDKRIYDKLKKAVDLLIRTQNDKGGWRYMPKIMDDDLSVTVMQLLALRAAKDAGIAVPKETIERAIRYVESCRSPKDNEGLAGFSYTPHGGKSWSTTAAGVMSLMLCGNYKANNLKDGLDYLMKTRERKQDTQWFVYGHYYAAQAMYQAGSQGEKFKAYWMKWYPDLSKTIISKQSKAGPQRGQFQADTGYGVWSTGMCTLILGIPYRYLPIYQR